jgi:hypothetical protein
MLSFVGAFEFVLVGFSLTEQKINRFWVIREIYREFPQKLSIDRFFVDKIGSRFKQLS